MKTPLSTCSSCEAFVYASGRVVVITSHLLLISAVSAMSLPRNDVPQQVAGFLFNFSVFVLSRSLSTTWALPVSILSLALVMEQVRVTVSTLLLRVASRAQHYRERLLEMEREQLQQQQQQQQVDSSHPSEQYSSAAVMRADRLLQNVQQRVNNLSHRLEQSKKTTEAVKHAILEQRRQEASTSRESLWSQCLLFVLEYVLRVRMDVVWADALNQMGENSAPENASDSVNASASADGAASSSSTASASSVPPAQKPTLRRVSMEDPCAVCFETLGSDAGVVLKLLLISLSLSLSSFSFWLSLFEVLARFSLLSAFLCV